MTTPNDEQREVARAILQAIVQRKLVQGDLAAIDAIASALAAERAKERNRLKAFALELKQQIAAYTWGCDHDTEIIKKVLAEIETAAAGKEGK